MNGKFKAMIKRNDLLMSSSGSRHRRPGPIVRALMPSLISVSLSMIWSPNSVAQHMNATTAPCRQPATNAETGQCFFDAAKEADGKLNRTYDEIQKFFESENRADDRDALRKAQRLWMGFRDANCAAVRSLYGKGTGRPVNYWACMEAQTRQRIEDLTTGYGWLLEKFGHSLGGVRL